MHERPAVGRARVTMTPASRSVLIFAIVVAGVVADQATKLVAVAWLRDAPPIVMLADTVRLLYAENKGAFLGLGSQLPSGVQTGLFVGVVGGFVVAVLIYAIRGRDLAGVERVALALVASGGIGNLIDRVMLGAVRDFMNVGIGPVRTGIFNVADVALTVGAILFLLGGWLTRKRERES